MVRNRIRNLFVFASVVILIASVGILAIYWAATRHIWPEAIYNNDNLTEGELSNLVSAASGGDLAASSRLFRYYMWSQSDCLKAASWVKKVAAAGDPTSQCTLGTLYLICPGMQDTNKARFWYERAAEGGDSLARQSLVHLRAKTDPK